MSQIAPIGEPATESTARYGGLYNSRGVPKGRPYLMNRSIVGLRLVCRLLQPLFNLLEVERAWRLARRVVVHCLQELRRERLDGNNDVHAIQEPVVIDIGVVLRFLEGIAAEMEE